MTGASSGFGYNGEYTDAATGMIYLRARFYDPSMNRFSQKDALRGNINDGLSLNRYLYCENDPVNFIDSSGRSLKSAFNSVKSAVSSGVKTAVNAVKSTATKAVSAVKSAASTAATAAKKAVTTAVNAVKNTVSNFNKAKQQTFNAAVNAVKNVVTPAPSMVGSSSSSAIENKGGGSSSGSNTTKTSVPGKSDAASSPIIGGSTAVACDAGPGKVIEISIGLLGSGIIAEAIKAKFIQYGGELIALGGMAVGEPTPFGEVITALAVAGVTVAGIVSAVKMITETISEISLDLEPEPQTIIDLPLNDNDKPPIEIFIPEGKTETVIADPLPEEHKGTIISEPLPEEKTDIILEANQPNSKKLRDNMIKDGVEVPDYPNAAHHIIAGSSQKAEEARKILEKYGIDINDAENGVFLPTEEGSSESAYHPKLHTNEYYSKVNEMLSQATSKEDVLDILDDIREQLLDGIF